MNDFSIKFKVFGNVEIASSNCEIYFYNELYECNQKMLCMQIHILIKNLRNMNAKATKKKRN